jgi:hypothetical protein
MEDPFQERALAELKRDQEAIANAQKSREEFEAKERGAGRGYVRKNVYLCDDCGAGWVSVDIDKGVTPFMDRCPICETGTGTSLFYNVPQEILDRKPARVEWRKPSQKDIRKAGPGLKRHFEQGGLKRVVVQPKGGRA